MKNSLYVPKNTSLSSLKSIIVNVINETVVDGITLEDNNTWTGVQTFIAAPVISTITNTGTLTLPTTTGTLALTSGTVNLTGNQTIAGIKTFSSAPLISTITNTGTLTLPTTTGTLALTSETVDLTTNQTIAGIKTFSDIVDFDGGIQGPLTVTSNLILTTGNALVSTASALASDCNYQLISSGNGLRSSAAGNIQLVTGSTDRITISTTGVTHTLANRFPAGTAAAPAISLGANVNDGIYSSGTGALNLATAGILRVTFSGSAMTFGANYSVTTSGTATITSGSGGFTSAGPVSSSLASSAAACSVRPTNNANTGLFGTAATNVSVSVGGTAIVSCGTTGAAVTGTFSATGVSTLTGGEKIGSVGSTTTTLVRGTVSYAVALAAGGFITLGASNFTGSVTFPSTPSVMVSIQQASGASFWDQCSVAVVNVTTTQVTFAIKSNASGPTSGTAFLNYVAWN